MRGIRSNDSTVLAALLVAGAFVCVGTPHFGQAAPPATEQQANGQIFEGTFSKTIGPGSVVVRRNNQDFVFNLVGIRSYIEDDQAHAVAVEHLAKCELLLMLTGKNLRLTVDQAVPPVRSPFAAIGYVEFEDGTSVNAEVLRRGLAYLSDMYPIARLAELRQAEKEARLQKRGVWDIDGVIARVNNPDDPCYKPPPSPGETTTPRLIPSSKVAPRYPEKARRSGIEGMVWFATRINTDGSVRILRVIRSPDDTLTKAAREAVRKWRFNPAMKDGKPVAVDSNLEVTFTLQ